MISLQAQHLTKKFNQKIIFRELSFDHSEGILGISGANGSGKSTLMKCLAYLLRPTKGSISWKESGKEMDQKEVKKLLGYAAPYINLYTELSVIENLRFLIEVGGISANEDHLHSVIEKVQIPQLKDQLFGSLSTGQQQRVKLATTLVRNSKILMLDEPGSNLDEKGHDLVVSLVNEAKEAGKIVILASNDPNEIILCDEVVSL